VLLSVAHFLPAFLPSFLPSAVCVPVCLNTFLRVKKWQREQYQEQRANLEPGQLLLVLDFTSFSLEPDSEESDQRMVYVQDFIIVMEFIEDGKVQTEYIDFVCDSPNSNKHDFHFVLHAMQLFFRLLFH
jgi:hypothetical protein